jgi:ATP-dependent helicase/nuclease subunit B
MVEIAKTDHPATLAWLDLMARVRQEIQARGAHPANTVVLVPYAQLMQEARAAWSQVAAGTGFVPRVETTMNWCAALGGVPLGGDDLRMEAARDVLTAASLLARAGLGARADVLAPRVLEAAWALARVAAAQPPRERVHWGERLAHALAQDMEGPTLALELATARIALAWAANSSYATDVLFNTEVDLLVVLEGFQADPLTNALKAQFAGRTLSLSLDSSAPRGQLALQQALDGEDEARRAAASVLAHLAQGRAPVALVAQDRVLTRRVLALLAHQRLSVRDETGWKLSTTRAAAGVMGLLAAAVWDAGTDTVLDWLKNAPAIAAAELNATEAELRRNGQGDWRAAAFGMPLAAQVQGMLAPLQAARAIAAWQRDLAAALQASGQWEPLAQDVVGQAVLRALKLTPGAQAEYAGYRARLSLAEFSSWARQALEGVSFSPDHPAHEQVVVLPLSQLLGRPLPAVVLAGCDEVRMPQSPEPPGQWTAQQRALLGLPSRDELMQANRRAWHYALQAPHIDVLWRTSEAGEPVMPSGFVQQLGLQQALVPAADASRARAVAAQPSLPPLPDGSRLPVARLSASAYEDLRRCPYRFFALRQLRLQEADELDGELGKRDFGNWLHMVLKLFHEQLAQAGSLDAPGRLALLNACAEQVTQDMRLSQTEFLPFAASWPRVRAGYLDWLAEHEAHGAHFEQAEVSRQAGLGSVQLMGKIDRIDRQADGSTLVMDYKTENNQVTRDRVKQPQEDTQLAFYAALLEDDTLAAAYVNVGERDGTHSHLQPDIVDLRDQLVEGIAHDMARIAAGAPLPALGEEKACAFCAARGLCRKDFWGVSDE